MHIGIRFGACTGLCKLRMQVDDNILTRCKLIFFSFFFPPGNRVQLSEIHKIDLVCFKLVIRFSAVSLY